ncbi:MAG: acyl-CoA dehydratase activase [Oscillospiraceae bacterium]|jgi:predicted CoA-substrate-specific enzyme activase
MKNIEEINLNTGDKTILGIDLGSTTAKVVLIEAGRMIYERYERHFSQVRQKTTEMIRALEEKLRGKQLHIAISGSAGLGVAKAADLQFVQEVYATSEVVKAVEPDTSAVIELGGEDAKIIFFKGGTDERMNGSCAGGTGAFIDQMATLLDITVEELDRLSLQYQRIYPIASRCGVFAKTDIQPLLNQGANKADIAAGIYQAVVNQTIAGLAQGRKIEGKVMFLGGPLFYCEGLRRRFQDTLHLTDEEALFPSYARFTVAMGAALCAANNRRTLTYEELIQRLEQSVTMTQETSRLKPLFADEADYTAFQERHARATVPTRDPATYCGDAFLGIDCGSTTTKLTLLSKDHDLLYSYYSANKGNPVDVVRQQLEEIYRICGDRIQIRGSAVTGYGEELIKNAFHVDCGLVETMAHYTAAKHFSPHVDFILDIGGQDIKCFKIHNDSIDSIMLNEACSSGCGSFIETFAKSMGYDIAEFAKLGLFSKAPVELGTRCTVFMNSSVKQAQKDGADVTDISAGLSVSVVRNALYKVIRAGSADDLGEKIVVQGGTFLNDAVLRSFELEIGREVVRPGIAGLMGAFGAALYAQKLNLAQSALISPAELEHFTHDSKGAVCKGCGNRCHLTINIFNGNDRFVSGNKCEKGAGISGKSVEVLPNMHQYKRDKIAALPEGEGTRGTIGLPLALGMYELMPFWNAIFRALGFRVKSSGFSSRKLYSKGQYSIPSDTACYPAKLMHGHIETLLEQKVDAIFYPCLSYNFDEGVSDNHYNCPVVAYYSELLHGNMESLQNARFWFPYLNINSKKELVRGLLAMFQSDYPEITKRELNRAVETGYAAYDAWMHDIRAEGRRSLDYARSHGKRIMVLAGRPYHIDPEIGHGIDKLASSLDFVVVSEDSISDLANIGKVAVLNQWTYHARLYNAAEYVAKHNDCELVQLVSFGCGLDAITTDEVREILEENGKLYTQIKIDEITNLGAVKIRLRSLIGALEERSEEHGGI